MVDDTLLQHWIFTKFAWPFFLIFFIVFAILEKTKLLGDGKQINAIVAFVIGLIFVSAVQPKLVVGDMILFLTVAIIVVFVALILWGFVSGQSLEKDIFQNKGVKWVVGIVIVLAVVVALLWSTGVHPKIIDFLFFQSWSKTFWTNALFVVVIAAALTIAIRSK